MSDDAPQPVAAPEEPDGGDDSEGRDRVRYGVDLAVTVDSEHDFIAGNATNLSIGGVFVHTHIVHPKGTRFDISVNLGDDTVRGVGEVRWVRSATADETQPAGIGIRFVTLQVGGKERITAFLEQVAAPRDDA